MKHFIFIFIMLMSFCALATDSQLLKSLQDKGFSNSEIDTIIKIVKDHDTGIAAMKNGVVKFYNEAKGFGLIVSSDGTVVEFESNQCFIAGDNVEYKLQEGKKGLNAVNVKLARSINDSKKGFCSIIR